MRLLGELRSASSYAVLLTLERGELQRDVRVALLRALWDYLDRDTTWAVLEAAALSPDPAIARGVIRIPAEGLTELMRLRLVRLLASQLEHPEPRVRLDVLSRLSSVPVRGEEQILLSAVLSLLDAQAPDERAAAARTAVSVATDREAPRIAAAVARLLPNRRALLNFTGEVQRWGPWYGIRTRAVVDAVLAALAVDPFTASLRASLACAALPIADAVTYIEAMAADGTLHADALQAATAAFRQIHRLHEPEQLLHAEAVLTSSDDPRLRRLGLAR